MTSTKYSIIPQVISTVPDPKLRTAVKRGMMQQEKLPSWLLLKYNRHRLTDMFDFDNRQLLFIRRAKLTKIFHQPVDKKILSPFCI